MKLKRELGLFGSTMMGLGSILGTGVFVSIGIAAGIAGPSIILALMIAAIVATCNGLNSAQLAASHPLSGGTYEYGYKYLNPQLGFIAGWLFVLAKSASAATAALGVSGYIINILRINHIYQIPLAITIVILFTIIVLLGVRRSNQANTAIVSFTLLALSFFIVIGLSNLKISNLLPLFPINPNDWGNILQATALMFVAYTGYGRIATMGEEAKNPHFTIPRSMIITLILTMIIYILVAIAAVGSVGANTLQGQSAPLQIAIQQLIGANGAWILGIGAITAMLGVILNLILGLSRVLLAMGRRLDLPRFFALLDPTGITPHWSVIFIGGLIALLVLLGNVKTTWSFSAFNVLIYYAITNLAALQIPPQDRLYPKFLAIIGLIACIFLAFWVDQIIWLIGIGLIIIGLSWQYLIHRLNPS